MRKPNSKRRSQLKEQEDIGEAMALSCYQGKSVREIAAHLSEVRPYTISFKQVADDLIKGAKQLQEAPAKHLNEVRNRQLLILDGQQREAWDAWERSKKEKTHKGQVIRMLKRMNGEDGEPGQSKETRITVTTEVGDPRFLMIIFQCVQKRCELLGLDAPKRQELTGPEGNPLGYGQVVIELPDNGRPMYQEPEQPTSVT